jgi:dienelactone hydrolase
VTGVAPPLRRLAVVGVGVLSLLAAGWLFPGASRAGSNGLDRPLANGLDRPAAPSPVRPPAQLPASTAVGLRVLTFVDHTRVARFHTGAVEPRTLITQIRYPALGPPGANDLRDAPPLTAAGPFPLIVFGPGFAETPTTYARLLDAWARAGYVVAALSFPLTQQYVPGGRRPRDLVNQPGDMRFVTTSMLHETQLPASFLYELIAPQLIAVAGQSDGAATALADALDPEFADPRVRAAVILSGAELTNIDDDIHFPIQGPALLAAQGTRDELNEPAATQQFFDLAPRPKFLLTLIGATHLPPYTTQQPYLGVVEQVTIAFLDHYLLARHGSLALMHSSGDVRGVAQLSG